MPRGREIRHAHGVNPGVDVVGMGRSCKNRTWTQRQGKNHRQPDNHPSGYEPEPVRQGVIGNGEMPTNAGWNLKGLVPSSINRPKTLPLNSSLPSRMCPLGKVNGCFLITVSRYISFCANEPRSYGDALLTSNENRLGAGGFHPPKGPCSIFCDPFKVRRGIQNREKSFPRAWVNCRHRAFHTG